MGQALAGGGATCGLCYFVALEKTRGGTMSEQVLRSGAGLLHGHDQAPWSRPGTARYLEWLSLNIHFHLLFLDGVYLTTADRLIFRLAPPPTVAALEDLVRVISERVGLALQRQGLLAPRCTSAQFPDLQARLVECCEALQMPVPEA